MKFSPAKWFAVGALAAAAVLTGTFAAASTIPNSPAFTSDSLSTGIGKTDAAISLVRGTDGQGSQLSGYYGFVIDEGTASQEVIACNATGALLTSCARGLDLHNGTTTVTALELVHRRGASVKITTFPVLGILAQIFQGINGIPNLIHYDAGVDCTVGHATNALCTATYLEQYANNVVAGGAPTSTEATGGKVELGTLAEQASSFDGGAAKPTVLQTKNSTSTCQVVGSYNIVASSTTGKLSDKCFDQTYPYTFTGTTTFATTSVASSTISVANIQTANIGTLNLANGTFDYQDFTSSGTWTKPANVSSNALVEVMMWGAGGGGGGSSTGGSIGLGGGGGGGAFSTAIFRASDLSSTVTVTVGTGGAGVAATTNGNPGGNTTFGTLLTAYGGGGGAGGGGSPSSSGSGGGGGISSVGGAGVQGSGGTAGASGAGGGFLGGAGSNSGNGSDSNFGGGGGGIGNGGNSVYGGGGGGANASSGGSSIYGGGGGGGVGGGGLGITYGGNGGAGSNTAGAASNGIAPGGGGGGHGTGGIGNGGNGAAGEVRVWVLK